MTTVTIIKSKNTYKGFVCSGHSGYAASGKDIVCAAVSILVINTINSIEELAGENISVEQDDGYISCQFPNEINDKTRLFMESMIMGLKQIEQEYSNTKKKKYLKLIIEEV
jgi:hypothetical protein